MRFWDVQKGRELNRFSKFIDATALAFGPKGRLLAIGRADGLVFLLDAASGKTIRALSGHSGPASALAFSQDGRLLASGGADHLLRVWETATGMELLTLAGHSGGVRAAAFSPDGRKLLSGGAEGVGLIWDLTRGPNGAARKQTVTAMDLEKRWADLLSEDGPTVNGAFWDLALAPEQSVPFIKEQMRPLFGGDARRAAKLIVELDDDSFDVREHASAGLAAMGPTIAPLLKHALAATQSTEVHHRLQELLSKLKETIPWERERLRIFRALTALEESRAPAARELLHATAKEAVQPELKQAAQRRSNVCPRRQSHEASALFTRKGIMNLRKSALGVIGVALIIAPGFAAAPHALPMQESLEKSRVDGKYAMLLRQVKVEKDFDKYGAFRDVGPRTVTDYAGITGLPAGYWVYVYPYWYIWRRPGADAEARVGAGTSDWSPRHACGRRLHHRLGVVDAGRSGRMAPVRIRRADPARCRGRSRDVQSRRPAAGDGVQARRRGGGSLEGQRPDASGRRQRRLRNPAQNRF